MDHSAAGSRSKSKPAASNQVADPWIAQRRMCNNLIVAPRITETFGRPEPGLRSLDLPVTRRSIRDKHVEEIVRRVRDPIHRTVEGRLVGLGGAREAGHFRTN